MGRLKEAKMNDWFQYALANLSREELMHIIFDDDCTVDITDKGNGEYDIDVYYETGPKH